MRLIVAILLNSTLILLSSTSAYAQALSATQVKNLDSSGNPLTLANPLWSKISDGTTALVIGTSGQVTVGGVSATGVSPAANPVNVSGVDGGGLKRSFLMDTSGRTQVNLNDGSGNSLSSTSNALNTNDASNGSVTGGTAGTKSQLGGGIYNTSAPTLTNGQQVGLQTDVNGNLKITGSITASNPSVSTTGAAIPASATFVGGSDGTNLRAVKVSSAGVVSVDNSANTQPVSGTITANIGTSGSLALDASVTGLQVTQGSTTSGQKGELGQAAVTTAAPSYTTGQTSPLSLTTAGALRTDASGSTQPVSGTITANIGTSGSLALDASVTALQVTQGSTTSGQKGGLGLGAVTTAAPSYTTAQSSPMSLTTAGALRVDNSANTQPVSGTINAKAATPTAGTVTQAAITVGTSAVRATVSGSAPSATRVLLAFTPDSASTAKFYLGSSSVTSSGANRGIPVIPGQTVTFNSDAGDYYLISDTAAQTVYVMEQ